MNILQEIFKDNYEIIQYTLHPRDVEMENISKMINCGDPSFGGAMYACPHCGNLKFVPFQRPPKCVKDADKAGNKVFRSVEVMEHTQDNTADSLEKAVKKRAVIQKQVP